MSVSVTVGMCLIGTVCLCVNSLQKRDIQTEKQIPYRNCLHDFATTKGNLKTRWKLKVVPGMLQLSVASIIYI